MCDHVAAEVQTRSRLLTSVTGSVSGKLLSKCNILHVTSYLDFKVKKITLQYYCQCRVIDDLLHYFLLV